ncbi:FtsW/RodA/SpoVE family cell cycle protein [Levilactobacillus brevis]|uniref:Probable peptidoglycan glycosyltransferase FtsW n=1 Tax=Levilactobacillus brevis TaxID=1580 RepID=A0AB38X869_LEVBR|nr:FtsW/RodA/SpoVE family cell cycle protein [Levilactobacillus brevis]MBU5275317.1 FtsW/RodA/SpoVE family cell cycle protein [Levilactobacillus brevis]MBU7538715.1 FtsW/RodA/SpoVE family cell cycle protein [Levilactobacillus brevis]MBU7558356.1 FtsW/RodA/SpoVE family cell cycle protein [Levilactobacillus brevis]MBU7564830.1 FtsW/RodA/SpoVE family cell cycle protein [Levilactobacillus brevis]MBX6947725.1 FtsW/RodA/SpoVE family cell cycle protein [Levilactobacillus brevis]
MRKLKYLDYWLLVPYMILSIFGIVMVYSASADIGTQNGGSPGSYLVKQAIYVVLGLMILTVMVLMNLQKLRDKTVLKYAGYVALGSLFLLLVMGQTINGAAGWFHVGPVSIQPAEFVKFYLIIWLANVIAQRQDRIQLEGWWVTMRQPLIICCGIVGLILLQPDLGGATINGAIIFVMILASGFNSRLAKTIFVGAFFIIVGVFFPILIKISELGFAKNVYQLQRIVAFVNPFEHSQSVGQQLVNSYYALSNGGIFGVGWGNSIQKTGYLPEPNTDFIMAILAEELGLITALAVIMLLFVIILRTTLVGVRSNSTYQALICYGAATYLTVQTLFNLGGVLGMLPITGVTFPFISYGGSSTWTLALVLGLVMNISARQKWYRATH